ncbi:MAG: 3-deoxy-7-phosphoheptulonate synthase [Myxococcota bacterium]
MSQPSRRWEEPVPSPMALRASIPISTRAAALVEETRDAIRNVLHGRDRRRMIVVVGPCSIHDEESALEYAARLRPVLDDTRDAIVGVMRTYLEKPRTALGWKGFVKDPDLDGTGDVAGGLVRARSLLCAIHELGVPCASELVDPLLPAYLEDLLSWAAIGARTIESPPHREMASGLRMPVGFKNGTDGSVVDAVHAMTCARRPHGFLGVRPDGTSGIVRTTGNLDRHVVLRGGNGRPNYFREDIVRAFELAKGQGIERPIMVDCSHDNSGKDHTRQPAVCRAVLDAVPSQPGILGFLIESHLQPGRQRWEPGRRLRHGVSITDSCLGFDETQDLLREIAAVRSVPDTFRAARPSS